MRKSLWAVILSTGLATGLSAYLGVSGQSPTPTTNYSAVLPQPGTVPYDLVAVRWPHDPTGQTETSWAEVTTSNTKVASGADLVTVHNDGTVDTLVSSANGTALADGISDPYISFDGQNVYYTRYRLSQVVGAAVGTAACTGADCYRVNVATKTVTQLTNGGYSPINPNNAVPNYPVINSCPCPLPDGGFIFCSNRDSVKPAKAYTLYNMKLYRASADGSNVECITPMSLGSALHPFIGPDGMIYFSTYECQGLKDLRQWAIWKIRPDGTQWGPVISALTGPFVWHFGRVVSDGSVVATSYYNENAKSFGSVYRVPAQGLPPNFGPAYPGPGLFADGVINFRFRPNGLTRLTTFCTGEDRPSDLSIPTDPNSPRVGKVTHPSAAPGNKVLATWSPGAVHRQDLPANWGQIVLFDAVTPTTAINQMVALKTDPAWNYAWPQALQSHQQIYGKAQPDTIADLKNDGKTTPGLPEGTPFGYVGTASLLQSECFQNGTVVNGRGTNPNANDPFSGLQNVYHGDANAWSFQGTTTKNYSNDDVVALEIIYQEPTPAVPTNTSTQKWGNKANERMRSGGIFPVRQFTNGQQQKDPTGNWDTSILVKVTANTSFTFATVLKDGTRGNLSQTWHQLRAGEVRADCGACHGHSQQPVNFDLCKAAQVTYQVFDATDLAPKGRMVITTKASDQTGQQWSSDDSVGFKYVPGGAIDAEFNRDIAPILAAKCVSCHSGATPAAKLALDLTTTHSISLNGAYAYPTLQNVPDNYITLAAAKALASPPSGIKLMGTSVPQSRYVWDLNAAASLLSWKVFNTRLDGRKNGDYPTETTPGDMTTIPQTWTLPNGQTIAYPNATMLQFCDIDLNTGCTAHLVTTDDEKYAFLRWIDNGCLIDLGAGLADDNPPTVALPYPAKDANTVPLTKLVVGLSDTGSGVDLTKLSVTADFPVDGSPPGTELSPILVTQGDGRLSYTLKNPISSLARGNLTVKAADRSGNQTQIVRTFSVSASVPPPPPPPPPDPKTAAIADLQAQITVLQGVLAKLQADLATLQTPPSP